MNRQRLSIRTVVYLTLSSLFLLSIPFFVYKMLFEFSYDGARQDYTPLRAQALERQGPEFRVSFQVPDSDDYRKYPPVHSIYEIVLGFQKPTGDDELDAYMDEKNRGKIEFAEAPVKKLDFEWRLLEGNTEIARGEGSKARDAGGYFGRPRGGALKLADYQSKVRLLPGHNYEFRMAVGPQFAPILQTDPLLSIRLTGYAIRGASYDAFFAGFTNLTLVLFIGTGFLVAGLRRRDRERAAATAP